VVYFGDSCFGVEDSYEVKWYAHVYVSRGGGITADIFEESGSGMVDPEVILRRL
jgi:hypothetical protein